MPDHRLRFAPSQSVAPQSVPGQAVSAALVRPVVDSALLLQGQQEVTIAHLGQHYRLRVTALGKLILTK
ncbi:MAG: hemin uptake protein HemP [Ideonella sp.]|nr:hemin uptake protein HemP [Ideonella sp.]